jgi:hypothetical protein
LRAASLALCAACLAACAGGTPAPDLPASLERGLSCVAASYDRGTFDDDYLRFVYPRESLESPVPGLHTTYRLLDAYFILLMIRQAGADPGPASAAFEDAESLTSALAVLWRGRPIRGLRKDPREDGVALDTYAILAYLRRDAPMAGVVLDGLDGDGWLPANAYTGDEWYRLLADESWAARAVAAASDDAPAGRKAVLGVVGAIRHRLGRRIDPTARAILVIHALDALRDLPASGAPPAGDPAADDRRELIAEAVPLLREATDASDTLTLANLIASLAPLPEVADRDLAAAVDALRRRQDARGCWSPSTAATGGAARVFTTLRCVLAEATYRRHRLPGSATAKAGS